MFFGKYIYMSDEGLRLPILYLKYYFNITMDLETYSMESLWDRQRISTIDALPTRGRREEKPRQVFFDICWVLELMVTSIESHEVQGAQQGGRQWKPPWKNPCHLVSPSSCLTTEHRIQSLKQCESIYIYIYHSISLIYLSNLHQCKYNIYIHIYVNLSCFNCVQPHAYPDSYIYKKKKYKNIYIYIKIN